MVTKLNLCKLTRVFMKLLLIREKSSRLSNIFRLIFLCLLFVLCGWNLCLQLYIAGAKQLQQFIQWIVLPSRYLTTLTAIYVAVFRSQQLIHLVKEIISIYNASIVDHQQSRCIKCCNWTVVIAYIIVCLIKSFIDDFVIQLYDPSSNASFNVLKLFYIDTTNTTIIIFVTCFISIVSQIAMLYRDIFWAFIACICCLIKRCFCILNEEVTKLDEINAAIFQKNHQKLSKIVDSFNELVSPALAILLLDIIFNLILIVDKDFSGYQVWIVALTILLLLNKTLLQFLTLTHLGQQIRSYARNSLCILLDASMENKSLTNLQDNEKDGQTRTLLFTVQLATAPANINASNMFTIDYNLIKIVITAAITYFTIMTALPSELTKEKELSTYDHHSFQAKNISQLLERLVNRTMTQTNSTF
ncbi:hypothetical protein CHUAL_009914 [Chamberlinius hualienensis]